ncbi:putative cytokinetic ring protein SteA [Paenibacillus sp. N3.4]|uniref:putative cytokinetic ring protein SteA n=1 Tax=Paenibacillus sp. N3.4 TaxID=2603222 RepID=UPI0011C9D592|nr:putative cytokinetic ring protein SteA [Paenibacillus sp. N3.4]TXK83481.1 thiamine pyrophosphokinase [Paenibacillus sp. N3.4]
MNWSSLSLFTSKPLPLCKGKVSAGEITKVLLRKLPIGRIVVLQHRDIDEVIAQELIDHKVKAIINCRETMSGTYPTQGPLLLLQHNIPIWDADLSAFDILVTDSDIAIYEESIVCKEQVIACKAFKREDWLHLHQLANAQAEHLLDQFIENTLTYAIREKKAVMSPIPQPSLRTDLEGKHVMIVSRGKGYKKDLLAAKAFIQQVRPILIGVDGGADALMESGYQPHIIIGDMDSVTDQALYSGADLIVHAYTDGQAPGMARIVELGLHAQIFPCFGTSEDAALLLAFENRAEWLVTVGAHTHMIDFMEKGRGGMGSTLLVRMKIGARLVDIKSMELLYQPPSLHGKEAWMTVLLSLLFVGLALLQTRWIAKQISHVVGKLGGVE